MRRYIDAFEVGFNRLILSLAALTAASIGIYAVLIPINLVMIKFQLGNMWWLYEGVEYALYVGAFICAPWVLHQGAHVRVDVLVLALPKRAAARLERVVDLFGAALCAFLFVYGVRATISEYVDGTIPDKVVQIENWYMMSIFALCFLLLGIEFLLRSRRPGETADVEETAATGAGF